MADKAPPYVNAMLVQHSQNEFWIDLLSTFPKMGQVGQGEPVPRQAQLEGRFVVTPIHMKQIALALMGNIEGYEKQFGTITLPEKPPTPPTNYTVN